MPAGLAEYRQPFEGYDDVLRRYSEWLLSQREHGWDVVDVHGPMRRLLDESRRLDPKFQLAGDGVHANATGHWIIAEQMLTHWKALPSKATNLEQALAVHPHGHEVLKRIGQKQALLKDAWLTETGHKRPGMARGLPLVEAERQGRRVGSRDPGVAGREGGARRIHKGTLP